MASLPRVPSVVFQIACFAVWDDERAGEVLSCTGHMLHRTIISFRLRMRGSDNAEERLLRAYFKSLCLSTTRYCCIQRPPLDVWNYSGLDIFRLQETVIKRLRDQVIYADTWGFFAYKLLFKKWGRWLGAQYRPRQWLLRVAFSLCCLPLSAQWPRRRMLAQAEGGAT